MNKLIIVAFLLMIGIGAKAQTFGGIRGKNNSGTQGDVKRTNDALKVADSISLVQSTKAALNLDTIKSYIRADSSIQADILDWTSSFFPSFDAYLVNILANQTNGSHMTQLRDSTGDKVQVTSDGKMYVHASQAGAWTTTIDSNTTRSTINIGTMPAIGIDSNNQRNTMKVLNTVATSLDSSTQRSTIKISSMPSVSVDSTTGSRITQKISELVPLVAGTAYIGKTRLTDGTTDAEVVPLAGYNAGAVAIVDGSGNHITSFGGGTQYEEGTTTDPATGTAALMRYDATDLALTDEQMSMPILSSRGEQRTLQTNGAVVSDVLTVNGDYVTIPCDGYSSILLDKLGTFNMTITPQFSPNDVTYTSNSTAYIFTSTTAVNSKLATLQSTTTGQYVMNTYGAKSVRLLVTSYTSGTCSITAVPTNAIQEVNVNNSMSNPVYVNLSGLSSSSGNYWVGEDNASSNMEGVTKLGAVRMDTLANYTSANSDWGIVAADKTGSQIVKDQRQHRRTYNAAFDVTVAASATDVVEIIGSSSKTVLIHRITISGTQTTGGVVPMYLIKRSTASSGGTSTNPNYVPHSTVLAEGATATASIKYFTANPTVGSAVGSIWAGAINIPTVTTGSGDPYEIIFNQTGTPVLLSGTSQTLCLNLASGTITGGKLYVTVEWSETGE